MDKQYLLEELSALILYEDPIILKTRTHILVPDPDDRSQALWHLGQLLIHKNLTRLFAKPSEKNVYLFPFAFSKLVIEGNKKETSKMSAFSITITVILQIIDKW